MHTKLARLLALAVGVLLVSAPANAAKLSYECQFKEGGTWSYEDGMFDQVNSNDLAFTIDRVVAQSARLKGTKGSSPLKVVRAMDARHFIEVTVAGFLNITTIYENGVGGRGMPAVHSRHLGIIGQPLVSQYRGSCRRTSS